MPCEEKKTTKNPGQPRTPSPTAFEFISIIFQLPKAQHPPPWSYRDPPPRDPGGVLKLAKWAKVGQNWSGQLKFWYKQLLWSYDPTNPLVRRTWAHSMFLNILEALCEPNHLEAILWFVLSVSYLLSPSPGTSGTAVWVSHCGQEGTWGAHCLHKIRFCLNFSDFYQWPFFFSRMDFHFNRRLLNPCRGFCFVVNSIIIIIIVIIITLCC